MKNLGLGESRGGWGITVVGLVLSVVFAGPRPQGSTEPRRVEARGDFVHPASGARFPEEAAGFVRTEVTQFDDEGRDLAAGYRLKDSSTPFWVTFYVYPVGSGTRELREKFAGARGAVEERQGVTLTFEKDLLLGDGRLSGRYAAFVVRSETLGGLGGESLQHSYLMLFRWKDWWIKWRFTFSATEDGEPPQPMIRLVEALTPSEMLVAGGDQH